MLKKDIYTYSLNFFAELENKWGVLTAGDKTTGYNSLIVSWGGIGVLWGKKVAYLFVRKSRYTYDFLEKSKSVTLSFLTDKYQNEKKILGTKSGRTMDKMLATGLHYTYDPDFDGSYIMESEYVFKMKKIYEINLPIETLDKEIVAKYYPEQDEHTMFVCEIKQFLSKED